MKRVKSLSSMVRMLRSSLRGYVRASEVHLDAAVRYAESHPGVARKVGRDVVAAKKSLAKLKLALRG